VAIGDQAGLQTQGTYAVAIGEQAGEISQQLSAVAIGNQAGKSNQETSAVAIGEQAGEISQNQFAVAVGYQAGRSSQVDFAVAVGYTAGQTNQGNATVAIGDGSGNSSQAIRAVAVGQRAGNSNQQQYATALGTQAGNSNQGQYSVAVGAYSGRTSQADRSIVINASGADLNNTIQDSCIIKPIRNKNASGSPTDRPLFYSPNGGEMYYSSNPVNWATDSHRFIITSPSNESVLLMDNKGLQLPGYSRIRINGGNSSGAIYTYFPTLGDGVNIGYNGWVDNGVFTFGNLSPNGGVSRLHIGYRNFTFYLLPPSGTIVRPTSKRVDITYNTTIFNNQVIANDGIKAFSTSLSNYEAASGSTYNMVLNSQGGGFLLGYITSTKKDKMNIRRAGIRNPYNVLKLEPVIYNRKAAPDGGDEFGIIAEQADEVGVGYLCAYENEKCAKQLKCTCDAKGTCLQNFHYDKLPLPMLEVMKDQEKRLQKQEKELEELKAMVYRMCR
jgi:hypothetical protein